MDYHRKGESAAVKVMPASQEIINLLAEAPNVLEFTLSDEAKARVWNLVAREKAGLLTEDERRELDRYAQIKHLMRLVKAQARKKQASPE